MKINYFPNFKSILRRSPTRQGTVASRFKVDAVKPERGNVSTLDVDFHTQKDLEIFESEDSSKTLYFLCNSTRTEGGAQILRQRMERYERDPLIFVIERGAAGFAFAALTVRMVSWSPSPKT